MGNVVLFLIRPGIIDLGAFCVELWSFYVSKRISVPMSYISFWKQISYDRSGLRSEGYPCGPPTLKNKVGRVPLPKLGMTLIRVPTVCHFFRSNVCLNKYNFAHGFGPKSSKSITTPISRPRSSPKSFKPAF